MYCVLCLDKPDSGALRLETRQAHLDYVRGTDFVQAGGPLTAEDGETMIGSMLLLNVDTEQAAQDFVANDPYQKAGLFAEVSIHRWKHVIGSLAPVQP